MASIIQKYQYAKTFYFLSTLLPWSFWFLAAYISRIAPHENKYWVISSIIVYIGLFMPLLVTYFLVAKEPELKRDIRGRFFNFRDIDSIYLIITCVLMLGSILAAQAVSLLLGYDVSQFRLADEFSFSAGIIPAWCLLILAPVIEELSWHIYGTDCLRNRFNLLTTSLIFGIFWAVWHIPLAGIEGNYQSNVVETGWIHSVNFLVSVLPFVIIMNWLYYKAQRNIIVPIIFHITAGFFNELFATHPDSKVIQTGLLTLLAIYIVVKDKALFFEKYPQI